LSGKPDNEVWRETQQAGRFLITQDLNFSDLRRFKPGGHHGLLLVRLINPSRKNLIERVGTVFKTEDVETWRRCFVVLTDRKIRVGRP
jgi:predicted nuclease of predicted toxin-antitoxin system